MTTEFIRARRLGSRIPRSILLPPYMSINPYYVEWIEAIDEVWSTKVDAKIDAIANIRNMWVTNVGTEQKIVDGEMLDFTDWTMPEREILVKQVNLLGMKLKSAGVLTDANYQTIARYIGIYWFEKGTQAFIEFINFCLSANLEVFNLWSNNLIPGQYNEFTRENEDGTPPGTPIWEGGEWFPTAHVEIKANGGLGDLTPQTLAEFFYEIANYNLVLVKIENSFNMPVVDSLDPTDTTLSVVAMAMVREHELIMSNQGRYGADPPPTTNIAPSMPSQVWANGAPNFTTGYLLSAPTSWFEGTDGKKYMVYSQEARVVTEEDSIPTVVMGESTTVPDDPAGYVLIMGPVQYIQVPGGGGGEGRIPVWTTTPTLQTASQISMRSIGSRLAYVTNPDGWEEISTGLWTPYWL